MKPKQDKLPYPWRWCDHTEPRYCESCGGLCSVQTVEFKGDHFHPACALEIAIGIIEEGGFVTAKFARRYGAKL